MTPEQITMVQESFKKVAPISATAADLFYDRLFEVAPEVRQLFPDDMAQQKKLLMSMLATAVTSAAMSATTSRTSITTSSAARFSGLWKRASAMISRPR